jgi:hypothetical protein
LWHLETLALLGVLDMEKIEGYYLVSSCTLLGYKCKCQEDLLVCIFSCCGSLVERPTLVGSDDDR